jgi:hypothetical protein
MQLLIVLAVQQQALPHITCACQVLDFLLRWTKGGLLVQCQVELWMLV